MKGIECCAECAYYNMKTHICTRGATDEGTPTARFYEDCPLDDVVKVVKCKLCADFKPSHNKNGFGWCEKHDRLAMDEYFCNHGKLKGQ